MSATEVIIQFVGLCLFSAAVPNDPGVHAILPKIVPGQHHAQHNLASASQVVSGSATATQIEKHVAMLVFPDGIVVDDSQWPAKPLPYAGPVLKGYRQIRLDGEHITFVADGLNPAPDVPANMPRFNCPSTPGVQEPALTAGYQFPYAEAAAVIDIPEGKLSACNTGRTRVDTKLKLQTSGRLTIVGMKRGVARSLVLRTDENPRIYLLNVPDSPPKPNIQPSGTASHYLAYYAMLGKGPKNICEGAPELRAGMKIDDDCLERNTDLAQLLYAVSGQISGGVRLLGGRIAEDAEYVVNAECSNSAWP